MRASWTKINPYEPQHDVDTTVPASGDAHAIRVRLVGILSGLVAFGLGVIWIKVLRRTPTEVGPVSWTLAQILAFGGIAIAIVGVAGQICTGVSRVSTRFANKEQVVFGWNCVPATCAVVIGAGWLVVACFGMYVLALELLSWDFYRGLPILEIVLQALLYASGLAASGYCMIAGRRWMQENYGRALLNTAIGVFGPVVAYVVLFVVCDDLIRYML